MLDISKPDTKVIIKGRISQFKKIAPVIDSYGYIAPGSLNNLSTMLQILEERGYELEYVRLKPNFAFTHLNLGETSALIGNGGYTYYTVEEFMQSLQKPLTPEEILVTFLKHYRKFTSFKRNFEDRSSTLPITVPAPQALTKAFRWTSGYWLSLDIDWSSLCRQFNLNDETLDYTKIKGLKHEL